MTTTSNRTPAPGPVRSLGRVGLWGAPGSGKTTFLAALNIAVNRARNQDLMIFGVDDGSTDFLVQNTAMLTQERRFPPATQLQQQMSWVLCSLRRKCRCETASFRQADHDSGAS